jgi:hypothetical protein
MAFRETMVTVSPEAAVDPDGNEVASLRSHVEGVVGGRRYEQSAERHEECDKKERAPVM